MARLYANASIQLEFACNEYMMAMQSNILKYNDHFQSFKKSKLYSFSFVDIFIVERKDKV